MELPSIVRASKFEDHLDHLVIHEGFLDLIKNSFKDLHVHDLIAWLRFNCSSSFPWHYKIHLIQFIAWHDSFGHSFKFIPLSHHSFKVHTMKSYFTQVHFISKSICISNKWALQSIITIHYKLLHIIPYKKYTFYLSLLLVNCWLFDQPVNQSQLTILTILNPIYCIASPTSQLFFHSWSLMIDIFKCKTSEYHF